MPFNKPIHRIAIVGTGLIGFAVRYSPPASKRAATARPGMFQKDSSA
jgi:hypothetical protein